VLSVDDWAEIRRLRWAEGLPIKVIAGVLEVSRNMVRAAIASDGPPTYQRRLSGSVVDAVEPRIRELWRAYPTMPATVIAERIGWTRSVLVLRARVAELRPVYLPPDRPAARVASRARSRSATCGSRRSVCRSASARPVSRRSCRCRRW
jgi:transposase